MNASLLSSVGSAGRLHHSRPTSSRSGLGATTHPPHDPETLAQPHRRYLERLKSELLLNNADFTNPLRRFMTSIAHLSALMQRLSIVQQSLNSQSGNNVVYEKSNYAAEAQRIMEQLKASRSKVANEVQALIKALHVIDGARTSGRQYQRANAAMEHDGFVPWTGGGIDRLLLKFDYGTIDKLPLATV